MKTYSERTQSILQKAEIQKRKRRTRIKIASIISSVAAAIIAFNLVLFVPYTVGDADIAQYKSSSYYGVIQKLYDLTYSPKTTNNYNEWFGDLFKGGLKGDGAGAPSGAHEGGNSYQETTLNQTDGVIEGDLFKRSETHIFYLGFTNSAYQTIGGNAGYEVVKPIRDMSYDLEVYTIAEGDSKRVAEYNIMPDKGTSFNGYQTEREMYLSDDLSTITVITPCYDSAANLIYTVVINVDVSDLSNVKETGRTYVSGRYVSSRVTDGNILLISDFDVRNNVDFDSLPQYVPHVGKRRAMKPLFADDIVCPDDATRASYTVICSLDNELNVKDKVALLSFSDDVYVSENNLFATRTYRATADKIGEYSSKYTCDMTEIRIVPYNGDGTFGDTRSIDAAGSVLSRYSLDEYDGVLRAVTTVHFYGRGGYNGHAVDVRDMPKDRCALYCYDLDTLDVAATVTNFAPLGESVKSARFYGDTAYICTAEVAYNSNLTDPVFAFDLSDLNNITYKDTGTIPGYSLSLNAFTDNTLIGIGFGESRVTLKIELYEKTENDVSSVAKYEKDPVGFSSEFKAHLIDAENGIVGLGVVMQYHNKANYILLRYDGYELIEIAEVEMETTLVDDMRATVIDGYAYILEDDGKNNNASLKVVALA